VTPGPKPFALVLSKTEREVLVGLLRRRSTGQDVAVRARIVLACADPQATNTAIPKRLGVSPQSVVTWRQRLAPIVWMGWVMHPAPVRRARSRMMPSSA